MPDENKNGQGAGGNDSAAGNGGGSGDGEENVTMKKSEVEKLKSDLQQSNSDRDNYKKMGLQKKADERDLHDKGDQGAGDRGQGGGAVIDEKKVGEVAAAATTKVLRDVGEKVAKREFLHDHPEYVDDVQWTSLMSHLTFRGGEVTKEEVRDRMEAALFEHKRSTGKLEEHLKAEHERGVREGRVQGELGSGHGTGGAGDKNDGGKSLGSFSTPKGEEMARGMHVDPEKAKKVDPSKDNMISEI